MLGGKRPTIIGLAEKIYFCSDLQETGVGAADTTFLLLSPFCGIHSPALNSRQAMAKNRNGDSGGTGCQVRSGL
jgi:hypothetical protein